MLPALAADLQVGLGQAALLATAYALPYALMQLVFGPLGDGLGKARMIRIAVTVLTIGLALSALAPGFMSLMAARALSGAFGGGIIPLSIAAIGDRVAMAERQPALSRFLLATILGQMAGGTVSAALADAIGWRWTLGLYAVPAALASAAALRWLRERPHAPPRRAPSLANALHRYRNILRLARALRVYLTVCCEGALMYGLFPFLV